MKKRKNFSKEQEVFYKERFEKEDSPVALASIIGVNHKPHPYMIGPSHVAYASDYNGGIINESVINDVKCAYPGCNLLYDHHTYDRVMFLELKRDCTSKEINDVLLELKEKMVEDDIDGICFVETKEKFRITDQNEEK